MLPYNALFQWSPTFSAWHPGQARGRGWEGEWQAHMHTHTTTLCKWQMCMPTTHANGLSCMSGGYLCSHAKLHLHEWRMFEQRTIVPMRKALLMWAEGGCAWSSMFTARTSGASCMPVLPHPSRGPVSNSNGRQSRSWGPLHYFTQSKVTNRHKRFNSIEILIMWIMSLSLLLLLLYFIHTHVTQGREHSNINSNSTKT